ncbi:MAG: hypothetical protein ACON5A_02695, partial [Candidatus Comchoanobacterales bacterium]
MMPFRDILKQKECEAVLLDQLQRAYEATPKVEQKAMLHADDDYAFRFACKSGHLKLANWLWSLCETPKEQS